ncbi:hypothetical protein [Veillonella nakazawae]|uniref:hypothetical protein n=1 Tax=Veillonella nakazawae TaxID=2682456 RepID=UPI0039938595
MIIIENAKVLYKLGMEITPIEAVDGMGEATTIGGKSFWFLSGAELGATLGSIAPGIGNVIGGIVGAIAGSVVGKAVYNGANELQKSVKYC